MSLDGSEVECVMNPLTEDEMVEAVKGREGVDLEEVKARVMLMSDGRSEWGEHQYLVEDLRAGVMTDYGGTVLCNEIQPNPPNRGPNCEAIITLKEGAQPRKQRAMPMHGERLEALGIIADEWLAAKNVEPGMGPWGSPCFPVATKVKGKWRGVVDMRWVNEQCVEDAHPLPRIDEIMVRQGKSEIFSALDLKDAFHHIPLTESSRSITCTTTIMGVFQWRVVLMGWKNGVQYCKRILEVALAEMAEIASGYVDDILMGTRRVDQLITWGISSRSMRGM